MAISTMPSGFEIESTQQPRYYPTRYNAISATMLIFLGSQIIFKKHLWGSVDVNSPYQNE